MFPLHVTAKLHACRNFMHANTTLCPHDAFSCHIKRCESLRMDIDIVWQKRILTWASSINLLEKPKPSSATIGTDPYIFKWLSCSIVLLEINWGQMSKVIIFSNQWEAFVYMYSVFFILYVLVHFCSKLSGFDLTYSIL